MRKNIDHPALARVCRFAGEYHLPGSIHHNIVHISQNSRNSAEVKPPYYLNEFVQLIEYCRAGNSGCRQSTIFIWCHFGISRRIVVKNLHFWLDEMLARSGDPLYIDLSWVVFPDYLLPNLDAWVKLIQRCLDCFMIGSSVVGIVRKMRLALRPYEQLLKALPPEIRPKVVHDNFAQLFKDVPQKRAVGLDEKGIILPFSYEFSDKAHVQPHFPSTRFMEERLSRAASR